jgi:peroxiredoxin
VCEDAHHRHVGSETTEKLYKPGVNSLFGISTKNTEYQKEAKERLHLPYDLLSDE